MKRFTNRDTNHSFSSVFIGTLLFSWLFIPEFSLAQGPDTLWTRIYGGNGSQGVTSVQQTTDGGYMIAGGTNDSLGGEYDFYLIKTNSIGDTLWTRTYGGASTDNCYAACQTNDGGYILAGLTDSFIPGTRAPYVVKTDSLGDTLWTHAYRRDEIEVIHAVQQTSDGGYILVGHTSSLTSNRDFLLIRTNNRGDTLWTRSYGINSLLNIEEASDVQQTVDGGFIITGTSTQIWPGEQRIYMVRTDGFGDTLWTKLFGSEENSRTANTIIQTTDNGYFLTGDITIDYSEDIYAMKTNSQGNVLWEFSHDGGSPHEWARGVFQTSDGGYIIAGGTNVFSSAGGNYCLLIKIDESGDTLWTREYELSRLITMSSFGRTADGGYILAGQIETYELFTSDIFLIKTEPDVSATPKTNPVITKEFALHQNYPNPFNASTQIIFDLPKTELVTLKIYNVLGREVTTIINELCSPGQHSVLVDGSNLTSGIYFYRVEMKSKCETKKMLLLK
ncbi:T9SS type A sorting domain-containing protein [bacterium]|nr:T9SS type A sorting domain-containing protein [bacterium]